MKILDQIRKSNSMNEVIRLLDTIKVNSRLDPDRAVRNWSPDIRLNGLLEVVMEIVNRVDDWEDAPIEEGEGTPEPISREEFKKLADSVDDLHKMMAYVVKEVEELRNKNCACETNAANRIKSGTEEEPKPKNGRGRKTAQ